MEPRRVQLSRKRGWRMPANTAKIDRSTRWGNPFRVGDSCTHPVSGKSVLVRNIEHAIALFALFLSTPAASGVVEAAKRELVGKNLACWCKAGEACHGDILLQLTSEPREIMGAA